MLERKPPIRSTREDVAELADDINAFVIGLAERIDAIQDAELNRSSSELIALARQLALDADRLGYPGMAASAMAVHTAASDSKTDVTQAAIFDLTEIAQRIRQGHRGAA